MNKLGLLCCCLFIFSGLFGQTVLKTTIADSISRQGLAFATVRIANSNNNFIAGINGQVTIPFVGGLVAPNQGLFPEYSSGMHEVENTTMIVNRGLGNSIIPVRVFNRPEIVVVTLKRVSN